MTILFRPSTVWAAVVTCLALAACGGGGSDGGTASSVPVADAAASTPVADPNGGAGGNGNDAGNTGSTPPQRSTITAEQLRQCNYGGGLLQPACLQGQFESTLAGTQAAPEACSVAIDSAGKTVTLRVKDTDYTLPWGNGYDHSILASGERRIILKHVEGEGQPIPAQRVELDFHKTADQLRRWTLKANVTHAALPNGAAECAVEIPDEHPVPAAQPLTYQQLSACPESIEPLRPDNIGCVKGYFNGQIFESGYDENSEFFSGETGETCQLAIMDDGTISFYWNEREGPWVDNQILRSVVRDESTAYMERRWWSSLSTDTYASNATTRVFTLMSGFSEYDAGGGGFSGLYLSIEQDKSQQRMSLHAATSLSDSPWNKSCRAVLR